MAIEQSDLDPYLDILEQCELYQLTKDVFCEQLDLTRIGFINMDLIEVLKTVKEARDLLPARSIYYNRHNSFNFINILNNNPKHIGDQAFYNKVLSLMEYMLYFHMDDLRLYFDLVLIPIELARYDINNRDSYLKEFIVHFKRLIEKHKKILFPPLVVHCDCIGNKLEKPYVVPYRIKPGRIILCISPNPSNEDIIIKFPNFISPYRRYALEYILTERELIIRKCHSAQIICAKNKFVN